jgi:propanol-preferring alcohol dehydrogenase
MKAMLLRHIGPVQEGGQPLEASNVPDPEPRAGQLLIRVTACAVCHTELDEIEGRTAPARLPVIPGHQVVGKIVAGGPIAQRVGAAWIHSACGKCGDCLGGRENLCEEFVATGRDVDGGYAEYMLVPAGFAYPLPDELADAEAAPLLCAGAVGYRALRLTEMTDGTVLGLFGFGASNHLVLKTARHLYPNSSVLVFSRNADEQELARELGASWAGGISAEPPQKLGVAIDATPAWTPIVQALQNLAPGGRLVINAIRKEDTDKGVFADLDFPEHLWMEKEVKSVANVTRADVSAFLRVAVEAGIRPEYQEYPLLDANAALQEIKQGRIRGAKVLRVN